MAESIELKQTPSRIVMATDLSARCDRALDRAAQLARSWNCDLLAVNVLDPTASPQQTLAWVEGQNDEGLARLAQKQLVRDMSTVDVTASIRIVKGQDVAGEIRQVIEQERAGLLITAVAHNETLGRFLLGSTVDQLAQSVSIPMLVVRQRAHGPYKKILVGTDLSESSRRALTTAARMFADQNLILYHAQASALSSLTGKSTDAAQSASPSTVQACEEFLKLTPLPDHDKVHLVVQGAHIRRALPAKVIEQDIDLVVLGNKGAGGFKDLLLGSNSAQLLQWLPCDVLLVP